MKLSTKLLFVVLLLVIAGGGFAAWSMLEANRTTIAELETKNAELTKETGALKQQAAACEESKTQMTAELQQLQQANCKGVWTAETGCQEPVEVFSSPVADETLCFGKTIDVKWDPTLVKAETVDIMLGTSANSAKLATVAAAEGVFRWKLESPHKTVGGTGSFTIGSGLYRLRMQSPEGTLLGKDTGLFNIKKCDGKAAAKAAPKKKPAPAKKKR